MMIAQNIQAADRMLEKGAYQDCVSVLTNVRDELEPHMAACGLKSTLTNELSILRDISHLSDHDFEKQETLQNIVKVIFNDNGSELVDLAEAMFADILVDWNQYCEATH